MYVFIYVCMYVYIYIYIERERERCFFIYHIVSSLLDYNDNWEGTNWVGTRGVTAMCLFF